MNNPDEVKLEPCGVLVERFMALFDAELERRMWPVKAIPENKLPRDIADRGAYIAMRGHTGSARAAARAAIEATRPTAATDDVVKELVEALDKCRAIIKFHVKNSGVCCTLAGSDKPFSALEAFEGAVDALALASTGVTLNG